MTVIYLIRENGSEKEEERVMRNVTRIENVGGEYRISQSNRDSKLIIPTRCVVEILE